MDIGKKVGDVVDVDPDIGGEREDERDSRLEVPTRSTVEPIQSLRPFRGHLLNIFNAPQSLFSNPLHLQRLLPDYTQLLGSEGLHREVEVFTVGDGEGRTPHVLLLDMGQDKVEEVLVLPAVSHLTKVHLRSSRPGTRCS